MEGKDARDERALFTPEELTAAISLILPPGEVGGALSRLLESREGPRMSPVQLSDDLLDCLSLVSVDAAERVRLVLGLSPAEAAERRTAFAARNRPAGE